MAFEEPFYIVATLSPKAGKAQEVIDAIQPFTEWVQANEPGCLRYQMYQPTRPNVEAADSPIVFIELWKDMAALENHRKGEQYQALMKRSAEEQLLAGPPDIKILQAVGGFGQRS